MAKEPKPMPELIKISETEYGCSLCGFKIEIIKPTAKTQAEWQRRREQQFEDHKKECHPREDA
ncbi:MAG: hypothetical protein ACYCOR_14415 [Acidobacteriaceae bacterium]